MQDDWQKQRKMTGSQLKRIGKVLGMTQAGTGRYIGVSERTVRRMIAGDAHIPASAALLLRSLVYHGEQPVVPAWTSEGS